MKLRIAIWFVLVLLTVLLPSRSPAPLVFVPGEGWYYENYGENAKWQRPRAKEQLEVAEQAFTNRNYTITLHAARRVLRIWPLSDYAPAAQYLVGRCLEAQHKDEAAFNAYQDIIEKFPKTSQYNEVLQRQYEIANRFLAGEWFKFYNLFPLYRSMEKTAGLYEKIVNNGPYSDVAPQAQLHVGAAREKQRDYADAAQAYDTAADRYHDQPQIAADAMFQRAFSWQKQADTAEYDQGAAQKAIDFYSEFMTFFPDDQRVAEAQKSITKLKAEQVRGHFEIAQFYEKGHKWAGAVVYYNAVLQLDPNSPLAAQARQRIDVLKPRLAAATPAAK